jgi:OmpA-OmpF porin, OOP family
MQGNQGENGIIRRFGAMLRGLGLMICLSSPVAAQENPFKGGWQLDGDGSALGFQSVKNETKVEISSFASLTGSIAEDGTARVTVLLDSVDTTIDLRNVRMRFLFFETFTYPEAVITARIDPAMLDGLTDSRRKTIRLPYELTLHGVTKPLSSDVTVTLLDDNRVAVATAMPISIAAADFNLTEGIRKLEEAATVTILPSASVSFDLLFTRSAAAPVAPPSCSSWH